MAGRPGAGRGPGAADLARLRALASWSRTRRPRGWRRWRRGAPAGRRSWSRASRRCSRRRSPRRTCRRSSRTLSPARASASTRSSRELFERGYTPVLEVAGRGEFARRGGIVDVFPPSAPLPVRIEFFGDEIDSLRAFDPTDQRSVEPVKELALLPATEFLLPPGGADEIRARLGRTRREAAGAPRAGPRPVRGRRRAGAARRHVAAGPRARRPGDAAEVWAGVVAPRPPAWTTSTRRTLFVLDEPGDLAEAADFLWRQAEERHGELVEAGDLPKDWPPTLPAAAGLEGAPRTAPGRWSSPGSPRRPMRPAWPSRRRASPRATCSAGASPSCRRAARSGSSTAWSTGWASGRASSSRRDQAPRLAELLGEAGHAVGIVSRVAEAPPPGAIALVERSLNGGFEGGPDGLAVVTDRELFGTVRVRRPEGDAPRRPARHPRAADARRPRRPHRPRHRALRADAAARRARARSATTWSCRSRRGDRIFVPVEQINRVSPLLGRRAPAALAGWAARTGCARSSGSARPSPTSPRSCSGSTRSARRRDGLRLLAPTRPWQAEMEASFPYEETPDQLRAVGRGQGRHGGAPADGPAGRGRRGLRQDRGGAAGRVQGDPGRQAGRGAGAHDRARRAALHRRSRQRFAAFPINVRLLSRFVAAKEQDATIAGLASGAVDIVIGTHRLLQQGRRRSRTWAWSSSTRSSGSGSRRRSGSSSCGPRWTC